MGPADPSNSTPPLKLPTGLSTAPVLVDDGRQLEELCDRWMGLAALAVDTEFVRERTFFPGLGLIQINDGRVNALIDPLAITDLEPLAAVLDAPTVTKVLHSCSEDMEVFFHRFGRVPQPLFDTQVAATLAGFGMSMGYGSLVQQLCGVELPKGETRSNWLKRPLRPAQLTYAALDVAYLLPIHRYLQESLDQMGRSAWLSEEMQRLADTSRFLPDPETLYLQIGHPGLGRRELAVLRSLAAWRERKARSRDLPRNFVLSKAALVELASRRPHNREALEDISSLRPADRKRRGDTLLKLIRAVKKLPADELPERLRRPLDLSSHRSKVDALRRAIKQRAKDLQIPPEFLANRKLAEGILRRALRGQEPVTPPDLSSWRTEQLQPLVDQLPQ